LRILGGRSGVAPDLTNIYCRRIARSGLGVHQGVDEGRVAAPLRNSMIYCRDELSEPALRQVLEILAGVLAAAGLLFE